MNMNEKLFYLSPSTLLVINSMGRVRELHTPFRVICSQPIGTIHSQTSVFVEDVSEHHEFIILYRIFDKWYPYKYFLLPNPP